MTVPAAARSFSVLVGMLQAALETGALQLGEAALEENLLGQLREWQIRYPAPRLYMSVNVSSKHLMFPGLVEKVRNILEENEITGMGLSGIGVIGVPSGKTTNCRFRLALIASSVSSGQPGFTVFVVRR